MDILDVLFLTFGTLIVVAITLVITVRKLWVRVGELEDRDSSYWKERWVEAGKGIGAEQQEPADVREGVASE